MAAAIYAAHRVAIQGLAGTQQIVNVFNVAGSSSLIDTVEGMAEAFATHFKPILANEYVFTSASGIDMASPEGDTYTYSMSTYEQGTGGTASEIGVSALISWQDTITGRAYRPGRTFLGPMPSQSVMPLALVLSPSAKSTLQVACNNFLNTVNTIAELVIVHGMSTDIQQTAPITGVSVSGRVGHLDSRRK